MTTPGAPSTVRALARSDLAGVCAALGFDPDRRAAVAALADRLLDHVADQPLDEPPRWSGTCDDCTPFELSVAFRPGGRTDLRLLVDATTDPPSAEAYWAAGRRLDELLEREVQADLRPLRTVADLFAPAPGSPFATFHAVELRADAAPRAKVYVFPRASGRPPTDVVDEALDRLGHAASAAYLRDVFASLPPHTIALDLEPGAAARCKVYVRPTGGIDVVEQLAGLGRGLHPTDARRLLDVVGGAGVDLTRPMWVVYHLDGRSAAAGGVPQNVVVDLPLPGLGLDDDDQVARIGQLLALHGFDTATYRRLVEVFTTHDRPAAPGLHSFVSFQREDGDRPRVTVYFNSRAFAPRFGWRGVDPPSWWPRPPAPAA